MPYGTALWQVGDSCQQNGKFKILLTKKKRELFEQRMKTFCQHLHLLRTDIMVLVSEVWPEAFGNVQNNLKAIVERGWFPLNRILLYNPIILATMTETMIQAEVKQNIFPSHIINNLLQRIYSIDNKNNINFDIQHDKTKEKLNFNGGAIARHVADLIMAECDRENARERNKRLKAEGKGKTERIMSITKKMTAGKLVVECGSFHLDKDVLNQAQSRQDKQAEKEAEQRLKEEFKYIVDCHKADLAFNRNNTLNVKEWKSSADILAYLQPLRRKDDPAMPTKRLDLEGRFYQWSERQRFQFVYEKKVYDCFEEWLQKQKEKELNAKSKKKQG